MEYPRISIVTPVFNQANFIEDTIQSILSQEYPNLEYIIIDGGSTDGTVDIIKKYESQLAYWVSEPDKGMYDAIQKGFDRSTGEIMGWLNADDLYFNGCLFNIANVFGKYKEVNWLTGCHVAINKGDIITKCYSGRRLNKYNFFTGDYKWISQESTLWRRSLWEKAGGKMATGLHYAGDFELWLRFFQFDTLYYIKNCVGMFRYREGQLSSHFEKYINEVNQTYSKLKLNTNDKKTIETYQRKKKIADVINRTRFINGDKIVRLKSFEKKHFLVPPFLTWINDEIGYAFEE